MTVVLLCNQVSEMRLDQRAWVGIDGLNRFDFKSGPNFSIPLSMTNTGKTPALHVKTKIDLKLQEKGRRLVTEYPTGRPGEESNGLVLPQQHMMLFTPRKDVSPAQYDDVQNNESSVLYAYGEIKYDDIYGKPHQTTFGVMYYKGLDGPMPCDDYNNAM